jgi:hypothetical protein
MKLSPPEFKVTIPQPVKDEALDAIKSFTKDDNYLYGRPKYLCRFEADYWGLIIGECGDSFYHLCVAGYYYHGNSKWDKENPVRRCFMVRVDPQGVAVTKVRETTED